MTKLGGLSLIGVCSHGLFGPSQASGLILGGVLLLLCVLGWLTTVQPKGGLGFGISAGGERRTFGGLSLRTAVLVGLAFSAFITSDLMAQVLRDVAFHCGLAEVSVRIQHLEAQIHANKHDEMMNNVRLLACRRGRTIRLFAIQQVFLVSLSFSSG